MINRKNTAIMSYLTIIGWIIAFIKYKKGTKYSLTKFHLEQSFGLGIIAFITNVIIVTIFFFAPFFTLLLIINNLGLVILWTAGIISAYHGVRLPLPLIGFYFKDKFRFIQ